jgi:hypothetical protein
MKRYWGCLGFGVLLAGVFVSCGGESQKNAPESSQRDCSDVRDESVAKLAEADAHTIGECRFQSQCRLFTGNTHCAYGCGWVVATKDEAPLQAAVDAVNALCPDECRKPPPPCVPRQQVADCVGGKCVVVDELHPADCDAVRTESVRMLTEAASNAPLSCDTSSDCLLFGTRPKCVYDCGFSAATTDVAALQSAVDAVDALCPDECIQPASSCPPPVAREVVECVAGECVLKTLE